jgi:hypothetical protein
MSFRYLFLVAFLGVVLIFAALLAMDETMWWLAPVEWLSHYQVFHVVAHFSIFAGVVALYGPQKRGVLWVVLGGGILIELVQFVAGGFSMTIPSLLDSLFDIAVDVAGAAVCRYALTANGRKKPRTLRKLMQ